MTATLKYTTLRYFSQVTADSRNTVSGADQSSRPRRTASLTLPPRGPGHPCHPLRPAGFLPRGSRFPLPRVGQHDCRRSESVATTASVSGYEEGNFLPALSPAPDPDPRGAAPRPAVELGAPINGRWLSAPAHAVGLRGARRWFPPPACLATGNRPYAQAL